MKAVEYLTAVKAKLKITSDYALGKALKVSKQTAGKYARGEAIPGPVVAFRVAEILGDQPAAVIAEFEAERSERDGKPDEADEMKGWARKIAGGAASVLLALGIAHFPNADAQLATAADDSISYTSYRSKKKRRGPFDGLARRVMAAARGLRDSLTLTMAPQLASA